MEHLNGLIRSGDLDQYELRELGQAWKKLLADFGGYPPLPYNAQTDKIVFDQVIDLEGVAKKDIYKRIKEYIAINYGSIDAVLHYEDYETGKIIVKGYFPMRVRTAYINFWGLQKEKAGKESVRSFYCRHTIVYTIVEGKIKAEYLDLEYVVNYEGGIVGTQYIPPYETSRQIWQLYPVTEAPQNEWKERLSTLQVTNSQVALQGKALELFIESVYDDKRF